MLAVPLLSILWRTVRSELFVVNDEFSGEILTKNDQEKGHKTEDDIGDIRFSPPLYIQRYEAVKQVLIDHPDVKKVVDFGCAEGNFLKYLKNVSHLTEISAVDLDDECCQESSFKARPLACNYLFKREVLLNIKIYKGSVLEFDSRLKNYDAVTCIELIEHLHPSFLRAFTENIFGCLKPRLAIITTPNSDFNVLFSSSGKFRHWDHKFEWTRQEFREWCHNTIELYPSYTYNIVQIGYGPKGKENLGGCSQMAIFIHNNWVEDNSNEPLTECYKLMHEEVYPAQEKTPILEVNFDCEPDEDISDYYSSDNDEVADCEMLPVDDEDDWD